MKEDPLVGQTIAGFRINRLLGRGGMGEVYLAFEESLGRKVVLKFLARRLTVEPDLVRRFAREARAAARLNHPNVVTIYSVHEAEGRPFYAMEYVEGESLSQLIAREGRIGVRRALAIAAQVADALSCAHEAGILHRDIKPSNILLNRSGVVKVLDFGIAKILDEKTDLTSDGSFLGTLSYASPEQCEGGELDARADVYSFGIVLYEMLAGRPPYVGDTPLTLMKRIATEPPPDLDRFNPAVPPAVKQLVARMIEKQRGHRVPDCETVSRETRRLLGELGGEIPDLPVLAAGAFDETLADGDAATMLIGKRPEVPLGRPIDTSELSRPRRRRRILWTAGAVFLLVLVVAALQNSKNGRRRRAGTPVPTTKPSVTATARSLLPTPTSARAASTPQPTSRRATPPPFSVQPMPKAPKRWTPGLTRPRPTAATPSRTLPTPATTLVAPPRAFSVQTALEMVPAERDLVFWFDVRALLATPLFRQNESKVFSPEAKARLDAFFGQFGVDWRQDIDHLVLSGETNRPETLCVVFHGRWNEKSVIDRLRRERTYKVFTHEARRIHGVYNLAHGRLDCIVFLQPGIAACGLLPTLRQVCDAASGRAPSILTRPVMRNAFATLGSRYPFWALGVPLPKIGNPALNNLDAWVLRGRLTPDLQLEGVAWPRNRAQIEKAYNGLRMVVELWRNNRRNAELRKLGQNIRLGRTVGTLSVGVRIPYYDLVRLLDRAAAQNQYPFGKP